MVTLKDIAQKTGFSVNTVSIALNRNGRISKETRELICKCAEEMGYIPNLTAQRMRTGKNRLIALIVDDLLNPFLSYMVDNVILCSSYNDYDVIVYTIYGDIKKEKDAIRSAIARNVDGFLISPMKQSKENIDVIKHSGIPYVLIGRKIDEFGKELSVTYDDIRAGFISAEYLFLNGHKSLAFLSSEKNILSGSLRINGIRAAIQTYGGQLKDDKIFHIPLNIHTRSDFFAKIVAELDDVTAIICYDDLIAYETIAYLKDIGKNVPDDVSVIGFGNIGRKLNVLPKLSTVMADNAVLSMEAVSLLIKKINGEEVKKKVIPVSFIKGETVKMII